MRIIAGEFASRRIETRKGRDTRPTLEKVREAVFSSLGGYFEGGNCLDLYAGSGAVGLEALSRGMDYAVFSDNARDAAEVIKKNISMLKVEERSLVLPMRDTKALQVLKNKGMQFDLVYLDPPYKRQHNDEIMQFLSLNHMVNKEGMVVIESLKEESYQKSYDHIQYDHERIYGITKITYFKGI